MSLVGIFSSFQLDTCLTNSALTQWKRRPREHLWPGIGRAGSEPCTTTVAWHTSAIRRIPVSDAWEGGNSVSKNRRNVTNNLLPQLWEVNRSKSSAGEFLSSWFYKAGNSRTHHRVCGERDAKGWLITRANMQVLSQVLRFSLSEMWTRKTPLL